MSHVDALSRNPLISDDVKSPCDHDNLAVFNISTENWLVTLQLADPELVRITKILQPRTDDEAVEIKKNYVIKDNILHRKVGDQLKLVVPRNARWQVCKMNHDDIGHFGQAKTLERIQNQFWFPKLRRFVKKYVAACIDCAYTKDSAAKTKSGHLYPIEKKDIPFYTIHIDHLGPFVKSRSHNSFNILTVVDGFTKYLFAKPVKDTKSKNVIKVLENIFHDFGTPERIISDRGSSFTSLKFKDFCIKNGIKHTLNAVACPRANGQAERFNQTILNALSSKNINNDERDWDKELGSIQWGINNTVNATTKKSPTDILFGVKLNNASMNKFGTSKDSNLNYTKDRDSVRQEANENIIASQKKQKALHDANKLPAKSYEEGELVKIVRSNFNNDGKSKKLLSKFLGPYKIVKKLGNDRYTISNVPGFKSTRSYNTVVSADRMRPWINIAALEVNSDDDSDGAESSQSKTDVET